MVAFAPRSTSTPPLSSEVIHYATKCARIEASTRARLGHIRPCDSDDFAQDLLVALVERWFRYDHDRGCPATFITVVVCRCASSIVRSRRALRRGGGRKPLPLDERLVAQLDQRGDNALPRSLLTLDLESVVASLPPRLRRVCHHLCVRSKKETASILGISSARLRKEIAELRQRFAAACLGPNGYGEVGQ